MIVALAGGVGAARFLEGLVKVVPPESVTVVVNTGDDAEFYGLHVSPDIDIVVYTLAGIVNSAQGWGIAGDTFNTLEMLGRLGRETWFQLGDRDLATLIHRTDLLHRGLSLSEATAQIATALGVRVRILPMSDSAVRTTVRTPDGWLPFQEYFVKQRTEPEVLEIAYTGADAALPAPRVLESIASADTVILCPSNPLVSIGTTLAVPGMRDALRETRATIVAVSPIVGGGTIKGPADRMMRGLGMEVSPVGVARAYEDFLDALVLDEQDAAYAAEIEALGIRARVTDTIMRDIIAKERLARETVSAAIS
ncbi:MAG: 2-phospho-L-lactate transferase [Chloroflexota bacterium]